MLEKKKNIQTLFLGIDALHSIKKILKVTNRIKYFGAKYLIVIFPIFRQSDKVSKKFSLEYLEIIENDVYISTLMRIKYFHFA